MSADPELSRAAQGRGAESPRHEAGSREGQRRPGPESARAHRGLRGPHVFPREPEQTGILHGSRKPWLLTLLHFYNSFVDVQIVCCNL